MTTILVINANAAAKWLAAVLALGGNLVFEPPTMQQANEWLIKKDFDVVLYGVKNNPDGSMVKISRHKNTRIVHVADYACESSLRSALE